MKNRSNSRTENSIINIFFSFIYQLTMLILSFVSRTIFLQVLSVDYLGINGLFTDILQMLSLADLGFNTAMTYSFYKPLAEGNKKRIASLIFFYKKVYRVIAISIATIGVMITPFIELIVNTEKDIPLLHVYYLFALAGVVVSYLFVYKTTLLIADQKKYYTVKISIIINIIKTTLQIVTLLAFKNYIVYLSLSLGFNFLNNYIISKQAEKEYPFLQDKVEELDGSEKRNIFKNLKSVFLYKVSGILLNATDNIFISLLVSTVAVGYYSNYLMISTKITGFLSLGFGAITASVGNVVATEDTKKRYEIFQTLQAISFILCGIIVSSYMILINDFILIWLGKNYVFDLLTVVTIALNLYLGCVLQPIWLYREATGLYRKTKYLMLITAVLNIIFSYIFGMRWGLKGILLASIVSRILTYIWYEPYLLFKQYFNMSANKYYFDLVCNICVVLICVVTNIIIFRNFIVDGWKKLFLKAGITGVVTVIEFIGVYYRTEGCKLLLNRIRGVLIKYLGKR